MTTKTTSPDTIFDRTIEASAEYGTRVYLLSEGGSIPDQHMCGRCILDTHDVDYAIQCIVRRSRGTCLGCDTND
jgi:hypothetical protein